MLPKPTHEWECKVNQETSHYEHLMKVFSLAPVILKTACVTYQMNEMELILSTDSLAISNDAFLREERKFT